MFCSHLILIPEYADRPFDARDTTWSPEQEQASFFYADRPGDDDGGPDALEAARPPAGARVPARDGAARARHRLAVRARPHHHHAQRDLRASVRVHA